MDAPPPGDPRWIVLAPDGEHWVTGRADPPDDAQTERLATMLRMAGHAGGWIAVMSGSHETGDAEVLMLNDIGTPEGTFGQAVAAMGDKGQLGGSPPAPRDPRWVLLAPDGRYSTLGRLEPDGFALQHAAEALERSGLSGGWVAVMSDSEHAAREPELVMVREVGGPPAGGFGHAVAALLARRRERAG